MDKREEESGSSFMPEWTLKILREKSLERNSREKDSNEIWILGVQKKLLT